MHWVEFFFSRKMTTSHYCESATEKIACIEREFDTRILAYQTQPFSVFYVFNGQRRRYTPDAMVFWADGRVTFEEVKPENWEHGSEFELVQSEFYEQTGYPLELRVVSTHPRIRARLRNLYAAWNAGIDSHLAETVVIH
jgi:hypothetical protein